MDTKDYRFYVEVLRKHLPELRETYRVKSLGVFGSYVRGEQTAESDLDVLVEFYAAPSLVEFIKLEDLLQQLAGVPVDLVMASALKPNLKGAAHFRSAPLLLLSDTFANFMDCLHNSACGRVRICAHDVLAAVGTLS